MRSALRLLLGIGLLAAPVVVIGPPLPLSEAEALYLHGVVGAAAAALVAVVVGGRHGPLSGLLVVSLIAIAAEAIQSLAPRRSSDPTDALAGIFGAAVGALLILTGRQLRSRLAGRRGAPRIAVHQPRRNP